jgi:phage terminase small subunit
LKKLGLNPKQSRFVQEYFIDLNATQAAIRAGYSKKTAGSIGEEILKKPEIQNAISEAQKKLSEKSGITKERWLKELELIYFADMKDFVDVDPDTGATRVKGYGEMPEGSSRVISSIEENRTIREDAKGQDSIIFAKFKFKLHDKLKAGEMIGNHLGFLNGKFEGNLNINTGDKKFIIEVRHTKDEEKKV